MDTALACRPPDACSQGGNLGVWARFCSRAKPSRRHGNPIMQKGRTSPQGLRRKKEARHALTTIKGIVIPVEWDEDGNALSIIISSPGEQDYFVERDAKGKELLRHLRQEIEVSGIVRMGIKGRNTIRVRSYRLKRAGNWQGGGGLQEAADVPSP